MKRKPQRRMVALYQRLLRLYPQAFRETFAESMAQTFDDLCAEQRNLRTLASFVFILWLFVETAIGIVTAHVDQFRQGVFMKTIANDLRFAAILSLFLVLPFAILELFLSEATKQNLVNFPVTLFGLLWLLPTLFTTILMPLVRTNRAGQAIMAYPLRLALQLVLLTLLAIVWLSIVNDQMPCFLGIPNCD